MSGDLQGLVEDDEEEADVVDGEAASESSTATSSSSSSFFSALRGLVGSKSLTEEDIAPALQKMKDTMISKNVASEIAEKLCESVAQKLQVAIMVFPLKAQKDFASICWVRAVIACVCSRFLLKTLTLVLFSFQFPVI